MLTKPVHHEEDHRLEIDHHLETETIIPMLNTLVLAKATDQEDRQVMDHTDQETEIATEYQTIDGQIETDET